MNNKIFFSASFLLSIVLAFFVFSNKDKKIEKSMSLNDNINKNYSIKEVWKSIHDVNTEVRNKDFTKNKENITPVNKEYSYWRNVKDKYGGNIEDIQFDMLSGKINGLTLFETVSSEGATEDHSWFIDIMRTYDGEDVFSRILNSDCCAGTHPSENLSNLVFKFSLEHHNDAAANTILSSYIDTETEEERLRLLYLAGEATEYTAGKSINEKVSVWLEDQIYMNSSEGDIGVVMAYYRVAQGTPSNIKKAEKLLLPLLTDSNALLGSNISLDMHLQHVEPNKEIIDKIASLLNSDQLSDLEKYSLSELYYFWTINDSETGVL